MWHFLAGYLDVGSVSSFLLSFTVVGGISCLWPTWDICTA